MGTLLDHEFQEEFLGLNVHRTMRASISTPGLPTPTLRMPMKAAFALRISVKVGECGIEDFAAGKDNGEDLSSCETARFIGVFHPSLFDGGGGGGA